MAQDEQVILVTGAGSGIGTVHIASKAAVEGLVHVSANGLRGHAITVNAVTPGSVAKRTLKERT